MMNDLISRQDAIDAIYERIEQIGYEHNHSILSILQAVRELPSAEPEWNNHTVACLLADMFDDPCACNYCGIDEWLPEKCEVIDSRPDPVGVACWEQFLTHRKDCVRHNVSVQDWYDNHELKVYPLVEHRGKAQGHEFDYQFCAYAERRTDEQAN